MKLFEIYNITKKESIIVISAKNIGDAWDRVNEFVNNANSLDVTIKSL